ncbi:hypothetical protein D3C81_1257880 [compost metagenome]
MFPCNNEGIVAFQFIPFCGLVLVRTDFEAIVRWPKAEIGHFCCVIALELLSPIALCHFLCLARCSDVSHNPGRKILRPENQLGFDRDFEHVAPEANQFGFAEQSLQSWR